MKTTLSSFLVAVLMVFGCAVNAQNGDQFISEKAMNAEVEAHLNLSFKMVQSSFDKAYVQNPAIPRGILEAISFCNTRFTHRSFTKTTDDAGVGMPRTYGIMGLTLDGQNYFRDNLKKVSMLSNISIDRIITNPDDNVMAYAIAFTKIAQQKMISAKSIDKYIPVLVDLCELPLENDIQNDYAMNTFLYGVFDFLNNPQNASKYNFPIYNLNLANVFGDNYPVLSSSFVKIENDGVKTKDNFQFKPTTISKPANSKNIESADYGPAIWNAAASCNYSVGRNTSISAVAVHYTAGSYAGCISWFKNCDAASSAHYCLRSSDGQITQMVLEANKAWHVRNENPYAIGLEHEAIEPVQNYFTVAMYQSSAALIRDICASGYGISPLRMFYRDTLDDGTALDYGIHSLGAEGSCTRIKGHQHFPGNDHTDPGPHWNWDYYFKQVNNTTPTTTYNTPTGVFTDDGGTTANYTVDNRKLYLIEVPDASQITLSFSQFALETNYDFMYIYNGNSVYSPKIGRYNTVSPGTITSSGNQLLIEFRSDCATSAAGWTANWTSKTSDNIAPTSIINQIDSMWVTADYTSTFTDADNAGGSGVDRRFYQVMYNDGLEWTSNQNRGFVVDNFSLYNTAKWKIPTGNVSWSVANGQLQVLDTNTDNSNIYSALNGTLSNTYLYDFYAKIDGTSTNKRFGFHFASDSASLSNRGNSYFIYIRPATNQLEFYKVVNNSFTQVKVVPNIITNLNQYYHYKIVHDRTTGKIEIFINDIFISDWTDPTPLTTPSKYFSFRSAKTQMWVKSMRVYRTRATSALVKVGADADDDIQMQSSYSSLSAKIKSVVVDNTNNYSALMSKEMRVDWTKPILSWVNDGLSSDLAIFGSQGVIRGNWATAIDTNSGIQRYKYAVGTSLGGSNVVAWTDNLLSTNFEKTGLTFVDGTTYYISVKAQNGAGLWSDSLNSNGATFRLQPVADFNANTQQICMGGSIQFTNLSANTTGQTWYFTGGTPATSTAVNPIISYATAGNYAVKLVVTGPSGADSIVRTSYISVQATPAIPAIVSNPTICQGSIAQLVASGSITLTWYSTLTGDNLLTTGATLNTGNLNANTNFYVRSEIGTCFSPMKTFSVIVEPMPAAPLITPPAAICSGNFDTLFATGASTIKWYNSELGDNLLATGTSFITPVLTQTTTYFARVETAHCTTSMISVVVLVNSIPEVPVVNPNQSLCSGQSIQLTALGDPLINWYNSPSTSLPIGSGAIYQTGNISVPDTFYVRSELNGCYSDFANIEIVVLNLPLQPTISLVSGQLCSSVGDTYQWFLNGTAIDSAYNQCFTPIGNGNYTVIVENMNGCPSITSSVYPYSIVNITESAQTLDWNIYPNPASEFCLITFPTNIIVKQIHLVDVAGKLIANIVDLEDSGFYKLNISGISKGIYFLIFDTSDGLITKKMLKK